MSKFIKTGTEEVTLNTTIKSSEPDGEDFEGPPIKFKFKTTS